MSKFQQINVLRGELEKLSPGKSGLVSVFGKPMMDRAFFPGGNGLILGEDSRKFPLHGTLILGSNFGADEKFCDPDGKLLCLDETQKGSTWNGLRKRFSEQQLEDSFFTNAWPFLHRGVSNNPTPQEKKKWLRDEVLRASCAAFFTLTVREMQPSLIVALGSAPAAFLSFVFPETLLKWAGNKWSAIDALPSAVVAVRSLRIACVAITHPSMNNAHCRVEAFRGQDKEVELLRLALRSAEQIKTAREKLVH